MIFFYTHNDHSVEGTLEHSYVPTTVSRSLHPPNITSPATWDILSYFQMISVTLTLMKHDQIAPRHSMKLKHLLKVHYQNRESEVRSITKGSIVATGP